MTALPFPGVAPPRPPPPKVQRPTRYLVVHLPAFRLERCGYEASEAAVLVAEERSAVRVQALTPAARELGLFEGMTATEARAVEPELAVEPLDAEAEAADRAALVHAFRSFTDQVAAWGQEGVALEVSGITHLHASEAALLQRVAELTTRLGHASSLALSDDPRASDALARHAPGIVPAGQLAPALAPLPLLALRPSPHLLQALATVGVQEVGQLARLDAASVVGRYGPDGLRLHQLCRGLVEPLPWLADPETEPIHLSVPLGGPTVVLGPVLFALQGMLAQVAELLERRDLLAVRLVLTLVPERGPEVILPIRTGRPTRSVEVLSRVARSRLEGLRLDAPAVELTLTVEQASRDPGWQPGLTERTQASEELPSLLARLADALGEPALFSARMVDSWRPEAAWAPDEPLSPEHIAPPRPRRTDPVEVQRAWERDLDRPRPTLLLPRPQPVPVKLHQGRPAAVGLERGWAQVHRASGPERLSSEWWQQQGGFVRDYWVVHLDQGLAWLFCEEERWFLHGWFD